MQDKCGRQVGDKCKLMRPKAPKVEDKCGRQVWETRMGDKGETSANSYGPKHPEWETSLGAKKTSVNSRRQSNPEWETSAGDKWETSVGDKCGRQV